MRAVPLCLAVLACACGGSSTQPDLALTTAPTIQATPIPAPPRATPTLPIILAGQSNAVYLRPFLEAVYPLPVFAHSAETGLSIAFWGPDTRPQVMFPVLAEDLHRPAQALVWWQGESDRGNPAYLAQLRDLITRARAENGNPRLFVIEVRVLDLPINADVRAAQEAFVEGDPNAVLISSDGFQLDTSDHLTDAGYRVVADRILAALR